MRGAITPCLAVAVMERRILQGMQVTIGGPARISYISYTKPVVTCRDR